MKRLAGITAAALGVAFILAMGVFYIQDGSFEEAGARMDRTLSGFSEEAGQTASKAAEATGAVIDDIADGPDNS